MINIAPQSFVTEIDDKFESSAKRAKVHIDINRDTYITSIRHHKPETRGNNDLINKIYIFKTTIKSINKVNSSILSKIFCLEVIYNNSELISNVDPILTYKVTSDSDTMYHH